MLASPFPHCVNASLNTSILTSSSQLSVVIYPLYTLAILTSYFLLYPQLVTAIFCGSWAFGEHYPRKWADIVSPSIWSHCCKQVIRFFPQHVILSIRFVSVKPSEPSTLIMCPEHFHICYVVCPGTSTMKSVFFCFCF